MVLKTLSHIALVFVLSSVKFGLVGVPTAVFAHWSFMKVMVVTISGGMTGVFFFTYVSEIILASYKKLIPKTGSGAIKAKRKFTFTNKAIVQVKRKMGLNGLAFITPLVISIPLGVFLAVRYYKDRMKIWRAMVISIICGAVVLFFIYHNLYERFIHLLHK